MLFVKMSSIVHGIKADVFASLSKPERIKKAAAVCAADYRLTARKAGKIY
jgi:hypothetical protein